MMTREGIPTLDILKTWEYVGGELPLHIKPHGWTPARCPVHGGFSASINQAANKGYCFGCEARGDGLDLIMEVEGVSLAEARERATESGLVAGGGDVRNGLRRKPRAGGHRGTLDRRADGGGAQDRLRKPGSPSGGLGALRLPDLHPVPDRQRRARVGEVPRQPPCP